MASRGVNKVIVVGNLGQDPDVKYGNSGSAVTRISVATSDQWNDKNTGEKKEKTEWHRVVFFGRLAEIAGEYLRKGSQVYIEGSLRTDKYTDQNGIEKYSTDIIAREMQMLGGRGDNAGMGGGAAAGGFGAGQQTQQVSQNSPQQQGGMQQGQPAPMQQPAQPQNQQPQQHAPAQAPTTDFDDDIPF